MKYTYGPYTPQETERLVEVLKRQNISFELSKDDEEEKNFKRSDFANIVTRAEYRTESYLAQIFYFLLDPADDGKFQQACKSVGLAPAESGAENLDVPSEELIAVQAAAQAHMQKKRWVARILVLVFFIPMIVALTASYFSK